MALIIKPPQKIYEMAEPWASQYRKIIVDLVKQYQLNDFFRENFSLIPEDVERQIFDGIDCGRIRIQYHGELFWFEIYECSEYRAIPFNRDE